VKSPSLSFPPKYPLINLTYLYYFFSLFFKKK
jgi:hypothetical protein